MTTPLIAAAASGGAFTLVFVCALIAGVGIGYLIAMWVMGRVRYMREERERQSGGGHPTPSAADTAKPEGN
jgi:SNF family Na+-dependent transporter